jgi:TolB-like protein/tetratricopeptide (TPR) repeat protein
LSLFNELKRRNVLRVGVAYIVMAWLIIQVVETLFPIFDIGNETIRIIVLILAVGLLPVLFFAWAFELTPEGLKREADVDRSQSITSGTGKKLDRWVIAMLALALAYFVFDKFILDPGRDAELVDKTTQLAEQAVLSRTPENSIAVLPFVNMSADPEQEFFSDGISEEILNSLAQVQAFKVAGRTSSFAFKGRNEDLRLIGEVLNVAHVLEGSVRKSGNQLRITAQLISVDDGYHLWSETFDRELTDVFAIQDEIAVAILEQLKAQLLGETSGIVNARQTDSEVYELYLQARRLIYERKQKPMELAAQLLDRALSIDPKYAPAHAQRGIAWLMLSVRNYGEISQELSKVKSREHLDAALELDPNLAEAWAGLGLWYLSNEEHGAQKAIAALEKALAINPNLLDAQNWMQNALSHLGDDLKALAIIEKMMEIDPLYLPAVANAVDKYNWLGQQEKSWALLERVKPFFEGTDDLLSDYAKTHYSLGQYALALPQAEAAVKLEPNNRIVREILEFSLNSTHQFELSIERSSTAHPKAIAQWQLGRLDEALQTAYEPADRGYYFEPYFQILNASGNSQKLIEFLEARWSTLDEFGGGTGFNFFPDIMGYAPMNEIALAYQRAGEHEKAEAALAIVLAGHEKMDSQGRNYFQFSLNRAVYYALVGDHEAALEHLAAAIDGGYIGSTRLTKLWPAFEPLEGDPRYEAIQDRMVKHLDDERKALGLEPIED